MQDLSEILLDAIRHATSTIGESADKSAFQTSLASMLREVMRKS